MSRSNLAARVVLFAWCLTVPVTLLVAAPGPDETAESQTYDVRLKSRSATYSGQAVFVGDPDRPQDLESGALQLNLTADDESETAVGAVDAEGTWWSWDFGWLSFWFAAADTGTAGQMFAFGLAGGDFLFARAGVFEDEDIESGRYCLSGRITEEDVEPEPVPQPEPVPESQPEPQPEGGEDPNMPEAAS